MSKKQAISNEMLEFIENRNILDKVNGVRLKHHDIGYEPKNQFEISAANLETSLAAVLCDINGIPRDTYFETTNDDELVIKDEGININDKNFMSQSILRWDVIMDPKTYTFRLRVLSHYIQSLITGSLEKMTKNRFGNFNKYEESYQKISDIYDDVIYLIRQVTNNYEYRNILLKNILYSSYRRKDSNNKDKNRLIIKATNDLTELIPRSLFFSSGEDDKIIFTIVRLSYILASGDYDLTNLPKFKKIEGIKINDNNEYILVALGDAIKDVKFNKRPELYKAFINSKPTMRSRYAVSKYDEIPTAISALYFLDWVMDDKYIHRYIKKFIG